MPAFITPMSCWTTCIYGTCHLAKCHTYSICYGAVPPSNVWPNRVLLRDRSNACLLCPTYVLYHYKYACTCYVSSVQYHHKKYTHVLKQLCRLQWPVHLGTRDKGSRRGMRPSTVWRVLPQNPVPKVHCNNVLTNPVNVNDSLSKWTTASYLSQVD